MQIQGKGEKASTVWAVRIRLSLLYKIKAIAQEKGVGFNTIAIQYLKEGTEREANENRWLAAMETKAGDQT